MNKLIPIERIEKRIYFIREQKVMLDRDLAMLYGVPTFVLNQAVKRNIERFPADFMFSLSREEILGISQFVISSGQASLKYSKNVNAFTENGVAMLSSVLRSKRAIRVNIQIMRIFTRLRQILADHRGLLDKINKLEGKTDNNTADIRLIFTTIRKLLTVEEKPRRRIGFAI
jgi:hypothetical protein